MVSNRTAAWEDSVAISRGAESGICGSQPFEDAEGKATALPGDQMLWRHPSQEAPTMPVPNVATILRDHVSLSTACIDRLYLNGYVPKLHLKDVWEIAGAKLAHRCKPE